MEKTTFVTELDYMKALRIVEQYHKQIGLIPKHNVVPTEVIAELLSTRTYQVLKSELASYNYSTTILEFSTYSATELMALRGLGKGAIKEINEILKSAGLSLKP